LVVVLPAPTKVLPSPFPEESQAAFEKNSSWYVVLGALLSVPWIVVPVPVVVTLVRTGKF
jgi:hypothetical protein